MEINSEITARVYHDGILMEKVCCGGNDSEHKGMPVPVETVYCSPGEALAICRKSRGEAVAFDRDELDRMCGNEEECIKVRYRREGDHFHPFGAPGGKSLKKFLIDRKIPAHLRSKIPLLICGDEILWVCGVMRSNIAPIGENTENAVVFKYHLEKENSGI